MLTKELWLKRLPSYICILFLVYMPLHVFLSQWLSLYTGGLEYWKLGKDLLLAVSCLYVLGLVMWRRVADKRFWMIVGFVVVYGFLHLLLWWLRPGLYGESALLGTIYNVRVPMFLGLGYGAVLLWPQFLPRVLPRIMIGIGTFVALFGVEQYFLPHDFMAHFGYSLQRGVMPAFFVDGKPDLPLRVMSTLREPNALGAYLIVPILMAGLSLWRRRLGFNDGIFYVLVGSLGLQLLCLLLSLSRSAWLGLVVSVGVLLFVSARNVGGLVRKYWGWLVGMLVVMSVGLFVLLVPLGHTQFVERYITHSGQAEVDDPNSNGYHLIFIQRGIEGILAWPLGHGPGTAGLASIHNPAGSFLTENYYIQIGYELGLLGLGLFVLLNIEVVVWLRRSGLWWSPVLFAAFFGYIVTNMLLHTWSNEAVAAQWWVVSGVVVGRLGKTENDHH